MDRELGLGPLLLGPAIAVVNFVNESIRSAGFSDIGEAHARAIRYTGPSGNRITDMARSAHLSKQTMSALVKELAKMGYVELVADPMDGRAKRVQLTARGREVWTVGETAMHELERRWRGELGSRDWARWRELQSRLSELASRDPRLRAAPGWALSTQDEL